MLSLAGSCLRIAWDVGIVRNFEVLCEAHSNGTATMTSSCPEKCLQKSCDAVAGKEAVLRSTLNVALEIAHVVEQVRVESGTKLLSIESLGLLIVVVFKCWTGGCSGKKVKTS